MSIRAEVEYRIRGQIQNITLLEAMLGGDEPVTTSEDLTSDDWIAFLMQWIGGVQDGLLHLADHVDQLASG